MTLRELKLSRLEELRKLISLRHAVTPAFLEGSLQFSLFSHPSVWEEVRLHPQSMAENQMGLAKFEPHSRAGVTKRKKLRLLFLQRNQALRQAALRQVEGIDIRNTSSETRRSGDNS
jgi:hypothetical protein